MSHHRSSLKGYVPDMLLAALKGAPYSACKSASELAESCNSKLISPFSSAMVPHTGMQLGKSDLSRVVQSLLIMLPSWVNYFQTGSVHQILTGKSIQSRQVQPIQSLREVSPFNRCHGSHQPREKSTLLGTGCRTGPGNSVWLGIRHLAGAGQGNWERNQTYCLGLTDLFLEP